VRTQVAIVGGGPGGSTTAAYLSRAGIDSVIIEKAEFPRFRVGEALTGEVGQIIRDLGLEPQMDRYAVKTAGTVVGPNGRNAFTVPTYRRDSDRGLIETTTWQVRRSTFDELMLEQAAASGVDVVAGRALEPIIEDGVVRGVVIETSSGERERIEADVVVDASGPATFLSKAGVTGPKQSGGYDRQVAVYSHFDGAEFSEEAGSRNTHILYQQPFHWAWYIPMGADSVSVGVVVPGDYFRAGQESKEAFLTRELRELNPALERRSAGLEMTEPVHLATNFSYRISGYAGPGFLCVGDAHRFIDPIFAFGVHLAMVEGRRAASTIAACLEKGGPRDRAPFEEYERMCTLGQDVIQDLVDCFWAFPFAFAIFVHRRYREDFIDLFAGRVYQEDPSPGVCAMRKMNALGRQRAAAGA
jgi:flavin-dependent dehydrogenase